MPRPTRFLAVVEPGAGFNSFRRMLLSLHLHHVAYFVDHAAHGRSVLQLDALTDAAQTEAGKALLVLFQDADLALHQRHFYRFRCHGLYPSVTASRYSDGVRISSTVLPRLAATSSG